MEEIIAQIQQLLAQLQEMAAAQGGAVPPGAQAGGPSIQERFAQKAEEVV